MQLMISEILNGAAAQKTRKDKIAFLRKHDNPGLRLLLKTVVHPQVKYLLPEGEPPYKPLAANTSETKLYSELKSLYLFLEGGVPGLKQVRRENLFISLLESIDPADAKIMCLIKDKKLPKGLDNKIIKEAYTDLL